MITLIAARDRNGAIGKDNDIPWHIPEDLKFFMRETMGGAIIMGRNTWDSLPVKPLKNRLNLVVTSKGVDAEHCFSTIAEAIVFARKEARQRIYAVGGAGIYQAMMPMADRLLVTEVDTEVDGAEVFFPSFSDGDWVLKDSYVLNHGAAPKATVCEYLRRVA